MLRLVHNFFSFWREELRDLNEIECDEEREERIAWWAIR